MASRWRSNQSSGRLNPAPPQPALRLRATWDLGPGTLNLAGTWLGVPLPLDAPLPTARRRCWVRGFWGPNSCGLLASWVCPTGARQRYLSPQGAPWDHRGALKNTPQPRPLSQKLSSVDLRWTGTQHLLDALRAENHCARYPFILAGCGGDRGP